MPESRPRPHAGGRQPAPLTGLSDALRAVQPRVHVLAASVLIDAGALEAAWDPIREAARASDDPRLRAELGEQLLRLGRGWAARQENRAATGALRLAARLAPARALPALARHLQREGSGEEALALWAEAIRVDPRQVDHHLHHGRLLETLGRHGQAHAAYLRLVEEVPTASTALTVAPRLEQLTPRLPSAPDRVVRIAMLGSATLDQLRDCLVVQAHRAGLRPEVRVTAADRYAREILDAGTDLHRFAPDVLVLAIHRSRLFPDLEDPPRRLSAQARRVAVHAGLDSVRSLLRGFRTHSSASVLLHNMVVPQHPLPPLTDGEDGAWQPAIFHRINRRLARLVSAEFRDVHLVDEDGVQDRCGKATATDPRLWLAAGMPWSESVLMPLAREQLRHLLACRGEARTCLVLGLDNTLWGGRVAERGVGGVQLGTRAPGNAFRLFQHELERLWRRGLRLAVCSRVAPHHAAAVLDTHPDMLLRPRHFAAMRLGCAAKPRGVREIAGELGIGLESVVFWDDSHEERARLRAELPAVLTPEVPSDPARHRQALLDLAVVDGLDAGSPR